MLDRRRKRDRSLSQPAPGSLPPPRLYFDRPNNRLEHGRLLRVRRKRPSRRAAEKRDEFAPVHSITSSARSRIDGGTARPSALAVLRLMTNSNLTGRNTGKLAGFSPLRIRPA